jgi:hypothetical protein
VPILNFALFAKFRVGFLEACPNQQPPVAYAAARVRIDTQKIPLSPDTSTIRGVPSEVVLNEEDGMKSSCAVNLHHAVTVSR